jgi:tetratricopeptide (TPR) repeat protein
MMVPYKYYIQFWIGNSVLAFGTGLVMGMFASALISSFAPLYFGGLALLLWQVQVCRYFWGDRQRAFQHAHQDYLVRRSIRKMMATKLGKRQAFNLSSGFMSRNGADLKDTCKRLLNEAREKGESVALNLLHLKLAELYLKEDLYELEVEHLKEAVASRPNKYIGHFRLGAALERQGDARGAAEQYEKASRSAGDNLPRLEAYALEQIDRIKRKGPRKKGYMTGLRYLPW